MTPWTRGPLQRAHDSWLRADVMMRRASTRPSWETSDIWEMPL